VTAQMLEVGVDAAPAPLHKPERSGEWLEYRPLITMVVVRARRRMADAGFTSKAPIIAISNFNTYNLLFLMLGALHWRPRNFLDAVAKAVPARAAWHLETFPDAGQERLRANPIRWCRRSRPFDLNRSRPA
jgi:short-chain fatty acids transporter